MKILVVNGSPKGKNSITLQTVLYIEKYNGEHTFEYLHAGQRIKALEKDFSEAKRALEEADMILFSYPVYTFICPAQLHRFIELVKASGADLSGKFMTQITTSKHFYDVTAHRYLEDNAHDLGMRVIRGLSADMDDLTKESGQRDALAFFRHTLWCAENGGWDPDPMQIPEGERIAVTDREDAPKTKDYDVVIVADIREGDRQLSDMIARFEKALPCRSRVVNLREYPFDGGCLGCFGCAADGKCVYKDGFDSFLREKLQTASAIIYAFSVSDHSMGALFKMYDDRQFCNGHRTVTMGMPGGYLISGGYSGEMNLRMILEGRAQVGGNYLCGTATDEQNPDAEIDRLAAVLMNALDNGYTQPANFYGVGGMKIFRDLIWTMQGMMKADHKFYKSHGQYDFPQKNWPRMLAMYLVGAMISSPSIKKKMGNRMTEGMLMPYKKVLDEAERKLGKTDGK